MSRFAFLAVAVLSVSVGRAQPPTSVVLISVDTLRADHLGCYRSGKATEPTPHIDALAGNGTLFSQISAVVPLTLPSHAAMFTATYPSLNGVEDNGVPLGPAAVSIATVLNKRGYRTAAFVGGFALDRRFGLSRGFDVYDSPFDLHNKTAADAGDLKRPGAEVAGAAMRWLEQNPAGPFFLFLHLYDLHTPYDLAGNPRLPRMEAGYQAELAYVDRVLGEFLAFLEHRGLLKRALIVFTSDHGEGLGEHSERAHGYFVYQSTLHVPLIFHWPAGWRGLPQDRVDEPGSLLDIAPTILDALGVPVPSQMAGRSLTRVRSDEAVYSESLYARNHFGCAGLSSLRLGRYKYIEAPKPELYDLVNDPGELRNVFEQQRRMARALHQRIATLFPAARTARAAASPTPENMNALRSLGYLSGAGGAGQLQSRVDPKDRIGEFERYGRATALASAGRPGEANALLQELRDRLPDVPDIRISLGVNLQQMGQYRQAAAEFKRVLERAPLNAQAHFDLGLCYFRLHRPDDAGKELQAALAIEPWYTRAEELLSIIYLQKKDYLQARPRLQHLLSVDPDNYTAHYNLGVLAALQKNWSEAEQQLLSALHTQPGSAEAHNAMGSAYLRRSELDRARHEFEAAIRLQPGFAPAHYNLGLIFQKQGHTDAAVQQFDAASKADPQFTAARASLESGR